MVSNQKTNEDRLEEYQQKSLSNSEKFLMTKVFKEFERYKNMPAAEVEKDVKMAEEQKILFEDRVRLMEMTEEERNIELEKRRKEFREEKAIADKEWEEAIAASNVILAEEDEARLKDEAELMKDIAEERIEVLILSLEEFLKKQNLAGCGGVLKKMAAKGKMDEVLCHYGYSSNILGLHQFFNEIIIGDKPIFGEKAFDNFLFQQKAYAIEREVSCLAGGLNQWALALTMGRKNRVWYQLDEEEYLQVAFYQIKKIKPEVAVRNFGPLAYGFFLPYKDSKIKGKRDFILSDLGKLILMSFSEIFKDQSVKEIFNPEAALVLMEDSDILTQTEIDLSPIKIAEEYGKELSNQFDLKFAELDFNNKDVIKEIKYYLDEVIKFDLIFVAHKIFLSLSKFLRENKTAQAEIQFEYQDILTKAKFITLSFISDLEAIETISSNFTTIFDLPDYDLWGKFKTKLMAIPEAKERDNFKKIIRENILSNEQILTEETLLLDNKKVRGTIKNWLADYHQVFGADKVEKVKFIQYLTDNQNTKNLSEASRKKLDYLLKFYEKLKMSSLTVEGVEEAMIFNVDGEIDIFEEGRIEKISREIKNMVLQLRNASLAKDIEESLKNNYREDDDGMFKKIEIEKEKILKDKNGNYQELIKLFKDIMNDKIIINQNLGMAILIILAKNGELINIFDDKIFYETMMKYLQNNDRDGIDDFSINPKTPEYLSKFIRHILEEKFALDKETSAKIGLKLFELLAKSTKEKRYQNLIYLDLEDKKLKWM